MADKVYNLFRPDGPIPVVFHDNGDGTYSPVFSAGSDYNSAVGIQKIQVEVTKVSGTTAYGANDVVGGAAGVIWEIPGVGVEVGATQYLVGLEVETDKKSITPRFRVHLFNAADPTIAADNANWKELYADVGKRLATVVMGNMTTATDATNSTNSRIADLGQRVPTKCAAASTSLWFAIETLDAFTPASLEKFTFTFWFDRS